MPRRKGTGARTKGGHCIRCGRWVDEAPEHHVVNRGMGGRRTNPGPTAAACPPCHEWIHRNPREAYAGGSLFRAASPEGRALLGESFESDPWLLRYLGTIVARAREAGVDLDV